jgi:hypothetical protein
MGADPATLFLISTAISATGQVQQSRLNRAALREQERRYQSEAETAYLQGMEEEIERRRQLEQTLANNRVFLGGASIGDDSGSFQAIQDEAIRMASKDIASIRLNTNNALTNYDRAIYNSRLEKESSSMGTLFGVSSTIANGWAYADYYKSPKQTKTVKTGMSPGESRARFGTIRGAGLTKE